VINKTGTDVMILEIFSPKNLEKKLAFLTESKIMQKFVHHIGTYLRKTPIFFTENWEKIAENCDHYIDPRLVLDSTFSS
jgi:hypothetical protein